MSGFSNQVIPSLPLPISGNGFFPVNVVVPNADSSFSAMASKPSTSYSYPLMDPAKLIGTPSQPFMNVGLPAYITTLYNNVFNINTNLQGDISEASVDDRKYPTSYAVQRYVQSQIAGTQLINNNEGNNEYTVLTTLNNTLIQSVPTNAEAFNYVINGNSNAIISLFWMDTAPDAPRVGTTKTVMFGQQNYLTSIDASGNNVPSGNLVFLYAGDNSNFVYMGSTFKYYQFVYVGDHLSFVQGYNGSNWSWLVTNCMGVFTNSVQVSDNSGTTINIGKVIGNEMPIPEGGSFGNF
jgi:hypothetical protein